MSKPLRPSEQMIEKICIECNKPVMVSLKVIRLKWGKNDWRHKECYLKRTKRNRNNNLEGILW